MDIRMHVRESKCSPLALLMVNAGNEMNGYNFHRINVFSLNYILKTYVWPLLMSNKLQKISAD